MASLTQGLAAEISDNWPAFLYIAVTTGFSIRFLCERRAETRVLKQLGEQLHETMCIRFDRLERLARQTHPTEFPVVESSGSTSEQLAVVARRA
jgi:hypothetical protein